MKDPAQPPVTDGAARWSCADRRWMERALELAALAAARGEVPVGAVLVQGERELGAGFNRPVGTHDPSAHAEMVAVRAAAVRAANYRLPGTTLYATLEPCPMCLGLLIHARVARVVYAAPDLRWGAAGTVVDLAAPGRFNHLPVIEGGLLADEASEVLRAFFRARR